jgi:uncharacterized protein (TIGR02452 family)
MQEATQSRTNPFYQVWTTDEWLGDAERVRLYRPSSKAEEEEGGEEEEEEEPKKEEEEEGGEEEEEEKPTPKRQLPPRTEAKAKPSQKRTRKEAQEEEEKAQEQGLVITEQGIYNLEAVCSREGQQQLAELPFRSDLWINTFRYSVSPSVPRHLLHACVHGLRLIIIYQTMAICKQGYIYQTEDRKYVIQGNAEFLQQQLAKTQLYASAPSHIIHPNEVQTTTMTTQENDENQEQSQKNNNNDTNDNNNNNNEKQKERVTTQVLVYEGDCIETAFELKNKFGIRNPVVLNMANAYTPGGGFLHGDGAQEENLHRRTNYFQSLHERERNGARLYPIPSEGAIYSPNLLVFRHSEAKGYAFMNPPELLSFIACAAPVRPPLIYRKGMAYMDEESELLVKAKMRTILAVGLDQGHDAIVLCAFGCGAFRCPPHHVAQCIKEVLEEEWLRNRYKIIAFGIFDDHNTRKPHNPEGNVLPFARVFNTSPVTL